MHTYTYTHTHSYTYICTCLYTYIYTHTYKHTFNVYICTRTSTPGTTARQRLREKPNLTTRSSTLFPRSTQLTTFSTSNTRTSLYQLPETPTSSPLFPTYPRAVHGPHKRSLKVRPNTACHSRVHNSGEAPCSFTMAPLRSCGKIRGKTAMQQSPTVGEHAVGRAQ